MIRRYLSAFLFVHGLALAMPTASLAYDWYWLDALSGPRFGGITYEWRAYCWKDNRLPKSTLDPLARMSGYVADRDAERRVFDDLVRQLRAAQWESANASLDKLLVGFKSAYKTASEIDPRSLSGTDAIQRVELAALAIYRSSIQPQRSGSEGKRALAVGVLISACTYEPGEERKASINVLLGLLKDRGHDAKFFAFPYTGYGFEEGDTDANSLFIIEPSYSIRVNDFIDVAAGAGVGIFSSRRRGPFASLILEPARLDVRPLNFRWGGNRPLQVVGEMVTVRTGLFVFPTGFAPEAFKDGGARIEAEWIHHVALVFDTEPLLRRLRGRTPSR